MDQVLIIAAEASSEIYARRLMEHWKNSGKRLHCFGVGSSQMEALGFERLGASEEMAVVGIVEIISQYKKLKQVFDKVVDECEKRRPKVAILMDYPGFNLRLAKELKRLGIHTVYYISPQIWAWRQSRVEIIKKYCDKVLLLFPFEKEFYQNHNVPFEFVGHPILDELDTKLLDVEYTHVHRRQCGINDNEIVLGLMPGSRRSEVAFNLPTQLDVARKLSKKYPRLKILIMVAPNFTKEFIQEQIGEDFRLPFILIKDEPFRMINLADLVLVASGTATLMVGLLAKPMVIMYKVNALTAFIGRILLNGYFGLANLILGDEVVPERLQGDASIEELSALLSKYIDDPQFAKATSERLASLRTLLGDRGATARVALSLEEYLK